MNFFLKIFSLLWKICRKAGCAPGFTAPAPRYRPPAPECRGWPRRSPPSTAQCRREPVFRRPRRFDQAGPPQNLFCGEIVHFPPAESGQKGRRGAFVPKAKCPPDPPFAVSEDGFCCTPAPRLPRGFAFPQRKLSPSCLPMTREVASPEGLTEGEIRRAYCEAGYTELTGCEVSPSVACGDSSLVRGSQGAGICLCGPSGTKKAPAFASAFLAEKKGFEPLRPVTALLP